MHRLVAPQSYRITCSEETAVAMEHARIIELDLAITVETYMYICLTKTCYRFNSINHLFLKV